MIVSFLFLNVIFKTMCFTKMVLKQFLSYFQNFYIYF